MIQKLGKYSIVEKLGEGAMGAVYKAYDQVLDRYVAVKTMAEDIKWDPELKLRFYREARSAASLHHPNIVTIHDLGEDGKITYIVMELLQGEDLKSIIKNKPPLPLEKRLSIMAQVADGLGHAHLSGIIHRDVKPGNIHVSPSGNVKIVDFGIARIPSSDLTRSGARLGTPIYMSPEQIRGSEYDERSDIFSAGIVFYELITYQHPFRDKNIAKTLDNILFQTRFPFAEQVPDAPSMLWEIINTCLAKEAGQRYGSMAELAKACRDLLVDLNVTSQRIYKQLQAYLPHLRQSVLEGRASQKMSQLLQQTEAILKQEERPDYCTLKRLASVQIEEPSIPESPPPPPVKPPIGEIPTDAVHAMAPGTPSPPQPPAAEAAAPPPPSPDELRGREMLQKGKGLLSEGRHEEALEQLRQAMSLLGPREEVVVALVEARRQIEQRKSAQSTQLAAAARQALSAKEYQRALDKVAEILAAEPGNAEALALRRTIQSEIEAEKDRKKRREDGEREKALGLRLVAEGKHREGRQSLERALEMLGDDPELRQALQKTLESIRAEEQRERIRQELALASEAFGAGALDKARRHTRFVLDLAPDHPEAARQLQLVEHAEAEKRQAAELAAHVSRCQEALRSQDFDAAAKHAGEALRMEPGHAKAHDLLREIERAREAKRRIDRIVSLMLESQEALRKEDFDAAVGHANAIIQLDPQNPEANEMLAMIGKAREAKRRKAEIDVLLTKAEEALAREEVEQARSLADKALALDPSNAAARELIRRANSAQDDKRRREELANLLARGQQAFLRHDLDDAERQARRMLALDAQHAKGNELLARIESAREKRRKEEIDARLARVTEAVRAADFERARTAAREAQQLDPANAEAAQALAEVDQAELRHRQEQVAGLIDQGRQALARQEFDPAAQLAAEALQLDPKSKAAKALSKEIDKERRKQEKLRAREAKQREQEAQRPLPEREPSRDSSGSDATALLDRTVLLDSGKRSKISRAVAWSAAAVVIVGVLAGGAFWYRNSRRPADDVAAQIAAARAGLAQKKYDETVEAADRILAARPDNVEAQALRNEALEQKRLDNINSLLLEAQTLKAAERFQESLALLERILQIDPANTAALSVQAEIQQMATPEVPSEDPAARVPEWAASARKLLAADKLPEAKTVIDRIARVAPAAPELAELRQQLATKTSDMSRKQKEAFEAGEHQTRLANLGKRAADLFRQGKYSEAQAVLDQWLASAPQDAAALSLRQQTTAALQNLRGFELAIAQKQYDEALRLLSLLEKANPADPGVAESRRRVEAQKAEARATLSIYRLGAAATLLVDDQAVGKDGEVQALSVPVGRHKITVQNAQGRGFEKVVEFYDGQTIPYVYDAAGPVLRDLIESDRELLNNRRAREEVHRFDAEHDHGLVGSCRGRLLISGVTVAYEGSDRTHSFNIPFNSLSLAVKDARKLELSTRESKRRWEFNFKDPGPVLQIKALWDKLLQISK